MKTTTALRLATEYSKLFPAEGNVIDNPDIVDTFQNWLNGYAVRPEKKIATCNWYGKVTRALFAALGMKQPKTKKAMMELLQ